MYSSIRFAFTENSKEFNVDCLHRRDNSLNIQKKSIYLGHSDLSCLFLGHVIQLPVLFDEEAQSTL